MEPSLDWKTRLAGKFIVFDGPDGCGKSTQLRRVADRLSTAGLEAVIGKDPGGTPVGDRIRKVLLDYDLSEMDVRCETFLFMASRAQLVGQVIEPALKAGRVVLCDRFISSTWAYQGAAGYDVSRIVELGRFAVGETWPDLTLVFDVEPEEGFRRTGRKPHHAGQNRRRAAGQSSLLQDVHPDAMEARPLAFHRKVRELFLKLPADYPGQVVIIDGRDSVENVHARVMEALERAAF
jgi:dTMP kinase